MLYILYFFISKPY